MTVDEIRGDGDNFPVGLRVLAVDDDPICLKLLETLLRKCQYHVTTTSQARMALKMLRENKDRFDLVISDVHMPDMDGFKLLEYVGLEMDLPVIMLSANGDPKLVMKGVTHGACDYLVKPVRIEELRNIWQHVLRRKKCDNKNPKKSSGQVKSHQANGEGLGSPTGNADQNGKFNRKRKEDEDESEDNENDEDPSTQKKPRVVWSIELHRKFVGAVNQLGIEKAVPKRILDLMNVDGLTRENVASHLQKYRLYLKRISSAASQQAHMAAAFGVKDSPFMHHMGSLDGLGDFRTLSSARLPNVVLSPYTTTTNAMLGRLNSPSANVSLRNLSPSVGPLQPSQAQNLSSSIASLNKMNFGTQNTSLFQGIPSHLEQNATNNNSKGILGTSNFNAIDELLNGASFNPEPFDASGAFGSSNPLLSSTESFHSQLPLVNGSRRNDASLNGAYLNTDFSSGVGLVGGEVHNMNYGNNIFGSLNSSNISGNGIVSRLGRSLGQNNAAVLNQRMDGFVNGRSSVSGGSNLLQQNEIEKPVNELRQRSDEDGFVLEETRLNAGFVPQSYDSLDELVNAMIKREQDETVSTCEFQFDDDYAFGNGI